MQLIGSTILRLARSLLIPRWTRKLREVRETVG